MPKKRASCSRAIKSACSLPKFHHRAESSSSMSPQTVRLPDGQTFQVSPVFAGHAFKSLETSSHMPMGWTIVLRTEETNAEHRNWPENHDQDNEDLGPAARHVQSFREPTLQNDTVFISSISIPSSAEFKAPASPTRQIAMMMWVTLYWYFHQPPPSPGLVTAESTNTPAEARPRGEWRINIKKDGVLRGKNILPKLERMGLIASANSSVGTELDDFGETWAEMFVSRRMFWQTPGRLFLFTLARHPPRASYSGTPAGSRTASPSRSSSPHRHQYQLSNSGSPRLGYPRGFDSDGTMSPMPSAMVTAPSLPMSQYVSTSHLPTYFPPAACQYTMSHGVRHPLRPKPPRLGEVFYSRFVPSVGQYLSFRVASTSTEPVPYLGPVGPIPPEQGHLMLMTDTKLLEMWFEKPRIQNFWGKWRSDFLENGLRSKHSFPAIGMWDGVPFGYFELYWVKEDLLGRHLSGDADDWDRGIHVFIGEDWARGRLPQWATALAHWCFAVDYRTMAVCLEPRVDNTK